MRSYACSRVVLSTLPWLAVHAGCTEVTGGAVEVSWDLRGDDGQDRDCAEANVDQIKLEWSAPGRSSKDFFPCKDARGVTGFDLPAGEVTMYLQPVCRGGEASSGFLAPPAIVRMITEGEVITLTTQIIDVKVTDCTTEDPCVCP